MRSRDGMLRWSEIKIRIPEHDLRVGATDVGWDMVNRHQKSVFLLKGT